MNMSSIASQRLWGEFVDKITVSVYKENKEKYLFHKEE